MRHPIILAVCMAGVTALAGCGEKDANATVERAFKDVNVVDETNLSDVMLTVADPAAADAPEPLVRAARREPLLVTYLDSHILQHILLAFQL